MSSLLKTVKAEIKAWERSFKAEEGREPTKEDIKALPELAAKYKAYRQLSKEAAGTVKESTSAFESANAHASSSKTNGTTTVGSSRPDAEASSSVAKRLFQTPTKPKASATSFLLTPKQSSSSAARTNGTSATVPDELQTPSRSNPIVNPFLSPSAAGRTSRIASFTSDPTSSPISRPFPNLSSTPDRPVKLGTTGSSRSVELISNSPRRLKEVLEAASADRRTVRNGRAAHETAGSGAGLTLGKEITPRTRARKRLRGEEVEDTPGRTKVPRTTTLGEGSGGRMRGKDAMKHEIGSSGPSGLGARHKSGIQRTLSSGSGKISRAITPETESAGSAEDEDVDGITIASRPGLGDGDEVEEDEEIFGPTPKKGGTGRRLGRLLDGESSDMSRMGQGVARTSKRKLGEVDRPSVPPEDAVRSETPSDDGMDLDAPPTLGKGKLLFQTKMVPLIRTRPIDVVVFSEAESSSPAMVIHQAPMTASPSPSLGPHSAIDAYSNDEVDADDLPEPLATEIAAIDVDESALGSVSFQKGKGPQVDEDLAHDVEWSSSEEDDFDDDGEDRRIRRVHKIRVEPYRLGLQKRLAQKASAEAARVDSDDDDGTDDGQEQGSEHRNRSGRDMMSVLSLASPQAKIAKRTEQLHEARAKAVFDPKAKQKLRANKRPPIFLPGEAAHEVDEDGEPVQAEEDEGDDDWESDPDGWKTVGLPDDDDW